MAADEEQVDGDDGDSDRDDEDGSLDLSDFDAASDDQGLSLDALSETYAELLGQGDDPYLASRGTAEDELEVDQPDDEEDLGGQAGADAPPETIRLPERDDPNAPLPDDVAVTPRNILEAMLFVGHPDNAPLTSAEVASMMRGVRADEIHELVEELNESYTKDGSPYEIASVGAGYQLKIRRKYAQLRDKFYRTAREARLSQAAIDVLAIVAYNQPLTRDEVEKMRGKPSGALLRQLVRRELLRIERTEGKPRITRYHTSDRFLDLFALQQVEDLPQSHELESR